MAAMPSLIEIGRKNFLLYLVLPYRHRRTLMAPGSDARLDRINSVGNEASFSGDRAAYDELHLYGGTAQTEYPALTLVDEVWAASGFGRTLDIGSGSGYFTERIARHATSVIALEPVRELHETITRRCRQAALTNVEVLGVPVLEAGAHIAAGSIDTVCILHALHHFHRREAVFQLIGTLLRPGGRLLLVEPHHNIRRVNRLVTKYRRIYRPRRIWVDERAWGTHHFLTVSELRWLCRLGGLSAPRIVGHWVPGARRLIGDDMRRRCRLERMIGRVPGLRHLASELALEAHRVG
jgi:SAM-dependent methyltransferase